MLIIRRGPMPNPGTKGTVQMGDSDLSLALEDLGKAALGELQVRENPSLASNRTSAETKNEAQDIPHLVGCSLIIDSGRLWLDVPAADALHPES